MLRPFAPDLWISVVAVMILGTIALFYAGQREMKEENVVGDLSVGANVLIMLGTFTGQGHPIAVRRPSSRAVLAVFLVMGFIVAQAYSAVIIRSLLAAPAPNIRNRAEYMKASLPMAVENYYHFSHAVFTPKMDSATRALYEKKVRPHLLRGGGYLPYAEAFKGVLTQKWAMFGIDNNIKLEMSKATPGQVCRLTFINDLLNEGPVCPMVQRRSELKDLLSRGYILALERGLHSRESGRHYASEVKCQPEHKRQWAPVKIKLVLSAVGLIFASVGVGFVICGVEHLIAWKRNKNRRKIRMILRLKPPCLRRKPEVVA